MDGLIRDTCDNCSTEQIYYRYIRDRMTTCPKCGYKDIVEGYVPLDACVDKRVRWDIINFLFHIDLQESTKEILRRRFR